MLLALEYLPLSLFGPGGILLLLTTVVSFLVARRAGRITPLHWIFAVLFNIPTVIYVLLGDLSHSSVMMYLVLGYGLGGFGMGWLLGILACWSSWRLGGKAV